MTMASTFDQGAWDAQVKRDRRRRTVKVTVIVAAVLLVLFYGVRVGWLFVMADEGDTPALSSIPIPAGAEVIGQDKGCGSGGCTMTFIVRPPAGQTPEELAAQIGAAPYLAVPGNVWDPRTVGVYARASAGTLKLVTEYSLSEWVP